MIDFAKYVERKKENLRIGNKCSKNFLMNDLKTIIAMAESDKPLEEIIWELTNLAQKYSFLLNDIKKSEGEIEGLEKAAKILQSQNLPTENN